jgi:hypothetical protein
MDLFTSEAFFQTWIQAEERDLLPLILLDDIAKSFQDLVESVAVDEFSPVLFELDGKLFVYGDFQVWHMDAPGLNRLFGTLFFLSSSKKFIE